MLPLCQGCQATNKKRREILNEHYNYVFFTRNRQTFCCDFSFFPRKSYNNNNEKSRLRGETKITTNADNKSHNEQKMLNKRE